LAAIIIFIILLSVLVFVHEMGHFLAAKAFGIRVDEFGFGYPPRAKKLFAWRGTDVTLNWLPFGGFVKIFGENYEEGADNAPADSFAHKNRGIQALVLVSGVFSNFLLAWLLFSVGFMIGMPSPVDIGLPVQNAHTAITEVLPNSPIADAGFKPGDEILLVTRDGTKAPIDPAGLSSFIGQSADPLSVTVKRGDAIFSKTVAPVSGIVSGKPGVGFGLSEVGTTKLGFFRSVWEGLHTAWELTKLTAVAFWNLIAQAFRGHADLSQVTGPVGIVGQVGDAASLGFAYLLSFAALISINLSIINLFPFPALDGGRLLFVGLEAVSRKRVPPRVFNWINTIGFAVLVLLMILVTIRDVEHLL
jgi:regulator of sigma E protease